MLRQAYTHSARYNTKKKLNSDAKLDSGDDYMCLITYGLGLELGLVR